MRETDRVVACLLVVVIAATRLPAPAAAGASGLAPKTDGAAGLPSAAAALDCIGETSTPIINSGFEAGASTPESWTVDARGYTLSRVTGKAHEGTASVSIDGPANVAFDNPSFAQTVAVGPVGSFLVTAWVSTAAVGGAVDFPGATVDLTFLDAAGSAVGSAASSSIRDDNDWTRVSVLAGQMPSGTRSVRIALRLRGHGTAWFDSVAASQATAVAQQPLSRVTLPLTDRVLQSQFLGFGVQNAPWYGPANPLVTDEDVALIEARVQALQPRLAGTFFSTRWWELAGWSANEASNTVSARVTNVAHDGGASLHVQGADRGPLDYRSVAQVVIPAPAAGTLRAGAWVTTRGVTGPAGESPGAFVVVNYLGTDSKGVGASFSAPVQGDTGWTYVTASGAVPPGTAMVQISLQLHGYGEVWFDSVSLLHDGQEIPLDNPGFERGKSFNTPQMDSLLRVLRLYERIGADINLRMYWPYDWAVADFPILVANVRELIDYLIRDQGLSRIRYLTLYPEPELFLPHPTDAYLIDAYLKVYGLMHDAIRADGLSVQLVGADECCSDSFFHSVVPRLASNAEVFSYHGGPDYRDDTAFVQRVRERVARVRAAGGAKPLLLWEYGIQEIPNPFLPSVSRPALDALDTFPGALGLAQGTLAAMNEGIAGASFFELDDLRVSIGGDVPRFGLFAGKDSAWRPRPVYYAYGLFTRLTEGGATVLDVSASTCDQSLPAAAVRNPDGTQTVYIINPWPSAIDVNVTGLGSGWRPKRYLLTDGAIARMTAAGAPFAYGYGVTVSAGQLVDRLPPRSIVAYSDVATTNLPSPPPQPCDTTTAPTTTLYLPNVTKTLGGPGGFQTPFIVQNTGTEMTTLEVSLYRFSDGGLVTCRKIAGVAPGTSFADVPNNDIDLPDNSQFSVVVRSFGARVVAVVNEHAGSGERAEALSYDGFSAGATTVYLPNIVRRFFGYHTPFIMQNLGTATTIATVTFVGRGNEPGATITRTIAAGQSQFIEPNVEPSLADGGAYAVTVKADQPLAVVVNTHNDDPSVAHPVASSADGIAGGGNTAYGPYGAKNANDYGRSGTVATIVVQNIGATATTPALEFTPLGGGATTSFTGPSTGSGGAWAFDPRFVNGVAGAPLCGPSASPGCLTDGEFTFKASANGTIAAVVNVISPDSAMGYTATSSPASKYFLPNVTRTLGGSTGWTTPILLQSVTATGASIEWRRFPDGALVTTQLLTLTPGAGLRIDPLAVAGLSNDTQYAATVTGMGGTVVAIVEEIALGGENAMMYEGFAAP